VDLDAGISEGAGTQASTATWARSMLRAAPFMGFFGLFAALMVGDFLLFLLPVLFVVLTIVFRRFPGRPAKRSAPVHGVRGVEGSVLALTSAMCAYQVVGAAKWFGSNLDLISFTISAVLALALLALLFSFLRDCRLDPGVRSSPRSKAWIAFILFAFTSVLMFTSSTPRAIRFAIQRSEFDRMGDAFENACKQERAQTGVTDFELKDIPRGNRPVSVTNVRCNDTAIEFTTGLWSGFLANGIQGFARGGDPRYKSHSSRTSTKLVGGWWRWQERTDE
jgi:hypothetical protein